MGASLKDRSRKDGLRFISILSWSASSKGCSFPFSTADMTFSRERLMRKFRSPNSLLSQRVKDIFE
jgi:hypothetical protein